MPPSAGAVESRVYRFIREYGLVSGGEKVLVAVSGGPDSVCLLQLLNNIKDELNIQLHVAHLDHGLRGDESEADARYVGELTAKLGIPCTMEKRDVRNGASRVRYHWKRRHVRSATGFWTKWPGRSGRRGWRWGIRVMTRWRPR